MMGLKERAFAPLVAVSLEELVPQDHFYRHLHKVLDLSFVSDLVCESYAMVGRPSIDPIVFFKLQLVMFFEGIRSERQLVLQAADRLSVRWYLGYDLDESLPDHSSLSRIRTRYGLSVFRRFFDAIVEQCQQAKLVWGKELYIDSTQVNANAAMDSLVTRFAYEAREAIQAHLAALFAETNLSEELREAAEEETLACPEPTPLPMVLSESERQEREAELSTRHDWIKEEGRQQREVHGLYQRRSDQRVSTTDPDATPMRLKSGGLHLGYHTHYVVDGGKRRIILTALVTPSEVTDNLPMLDLILHTRWRWCLLTRQVTGDTKYATIENIMGLEDQGIRAYVPLPDWEERYEVWSASHFRYEPEADQYCCPQGQILNRIGEVGPDGRQLYRAFASTCNACPVKGQCTTSNQGRRVYRHVGEEYLARVHSYEQTLAYQKALRKRQVWVEPLFAEAKEWHGMRRFRLRRLWRVNCEALVTAAGHNLQQLLKKRGWGRHPFPTEAVASAPPNSEPDEAFGHNFLKSKRPSVAVASLVTRGVLSMGVSFRYVCFLWQRAILLLF